jgi:hypothetical protein
MCTPANDPNIWELLIHLLRDRGPGTDSVVRLTAATALRECIDVRCISCVRDIRSSSIFHVSLDP